MKNPGHIPTPSEGAKQAIATIQSGIDARKHYAETGGDAAIAQRKASETVNPPKPVN